MNLHMFHIVYTAFSNEREFTVWGSILTSCACQMQSRKPNLLTRSTNRSYFFYPDWYRVNVWLPCKYANCWIGYIPFMFFINTYPLMAIAVFRIYCLTKFVRNEVFHLPKTIGFTNMAIEMVLAICIPERIHQWSVNMRGHNTNWTEKVTEAIVSC